MYNLPRLTKSLSPSTPVDLLSEAEALIGGEDAACPGRHDDVMAQAGQIQSGNEVKCDHNLSEKLQHLKSKWKDL